MYKNNPTYENVFVYGTLKRGFRANFKLDSSTFLGTAVTPPAFEMYGGGYPWLVISTKGRSVLGEVYKVDEETLHVLDEYEGYPDFYDRMVIPISGEANLSGAQEAFVYFIPDEGLIGSGRKIEPNSEGLLVWQQQ